MIKLFTLGLFFFLPLVVSFPSFAGKLYKIIDEKTGRVTYSQFPPKDKSVTARIENVEVVDDVSTVKPVQEGSYVYCGDLSVGGNSYYREKQPERYRKDLNKRIKNWEKHASYAREQLDRADKEQTRASTSHYAKNEPSSRKNERYKRYQETKKRNVKRVKEYNCAIAWAKEDIQLLNEGGSSRATARAEQEAEKTRLEGLIKKHTKNMYRTCGEEPIFDPTTESGKQATKEWNKCAKGFKRDISAIEGKIRQIVR